MQKKQEKLNTILSIPVGSNYGNLFKKILALLQVQYIVLHDKVSGTRVVVGYYNSIAIRAGRRGRDVEV